jgi:hypothetical protein
MKLILKTAFLLFIFFLASCKKNPKDTQPPVVTFNSPVSGQSYKMGDTIAVNAHVSDNEHLASVNVTLTDLNHTLQQGSYNVPVQSANFIININYILTNIHLSTGNYYIQITADDGYNTASYYQSIHITESPTQFWGYCLVLNDSLKAIHRRDSSMHEQPTILLNSKYNGMKYGGYYQQLYVNGYGNSQSFEAYLMQASSMNPAYSVSASTTQQNYTCLYTDGSKPYIGFENSNIYSYDNMGNISAPSYRFNTGGNTTNPPYPYYFTTTSTYGVGIFRNPVGTSNDQLVTFNVGNGLPLGSALTSNVLDTVLAVFEKSTDSLYVLGNKGGLAAAYVFSPSGELAQINMPSGKLLAAVKINNEELIFSTSAGIYTCIDLNVTSIMSSGAQKLSYQPKLNMLTIASGSNLNAYALGTASLSPITTRSLILGSSIVDFEVITNK